MRAALGLVALGVLCGAARPAAADEERRTTWLPEARAVPRASSAARDAPVFEYAYGPRAQASLGHEAGVVALRRAWGTVRMSMVGLAAFENGTSYAPVPDEHWRWLASGTVALSFDRFARRLGRDAALEVALQVGYERAQASWGTNVPVAGDGRDIAFGGGGAFVMPDVALRLAASRRWTLVVRLQERVCFNAFPLLAGDREVSDVVADYVREGLTHAPGAEVVARWQRWERTALTLAAFGEGLFAHDTSARDGFFVRALGGVVHRTRHGELTPFVSGDAGNGKGLLIGRREARLSLGVRYALD
ncbi:MAG TPA: hypothetical protein VGQ83_05295 [Polyangia bacterium]|jgi:hypothetical protein